MNRNYHLFFFVFLLLFSVVAAKAQFGKLPFIMKQSTFKRDPFSVVKNDAKVNDITLNTKSINKTIDECSEPGGVVVIPSYLRMTRPVVVKSNRKLHLQKTIMLYFTGDVNQFCWWKKTT